MQCPQNSTDRHFLKDGPIVFRTSQNMSIHREPEVENFRESNTYFICMYNKEKKYTFSYFNLILTAQADEYAIGL